MRHHTVILEGPHRRRLRHCSPWLTRLLAIGAIVAGVHFIQWATKDTPNQPTSTRQ